MVSPLLVKCCWVNIRTMARLFTVGRICRHLKMQNARRLSVIWGMIRNFLMTVWRITCGWEMPYLRNHIFVQSVSMRRSLRCRMEKRRWLEPAGVRLSGGQAQRLALARTLYHKRPVMILDDPFSALDINTEKKNLCPSSSDDSGQYRAFDFSSSVSVS